MLSAALLGQVDEELAQRHGLAAQLLQVDAVPHVERRIERGERQDGLRAALVTGDARRGAIIELECKGRGMAPPTRQRRPYRVLQVRAHIKEGGRARPSVEVFVGAAQREVGIGAGEIDGRGAGRMRKIPDGQCAGGMGCGGHGPHVMQPRGPVVHFRQHDDGHRVVDGLHHGVRLHDPQNMATTQQVAQALRHIEVGREIAGVGEDHLAVRPQLQRRAKQLEQVDGDRIACNHRSRRRTHELRDPVAHLLRQREPAMFVPRSDERFAPLLRDGVANPFCDAFGQDAERIAIEVVQPIGDREERSLRRQRIGAVEGLAVGAVHASLRLVRRRSCMPDAATQPQPRATAARCLGNSAVAIRALQRLKRFTE